MKVLIVGGGPAGMLAGISAKKTNNEVILFEKNNVLGKKLAITGKGRCNITSSLEKVQDFIDNTPGNGKFLYSAFEKFNNKDIINLLGIPVKEERGHRIFPKSDKASDVVNVLIKQLDGVKIVKNTTVTEILVKDGFACGVIANGQKVYGDRIIVAVGGKSYPQTGSTGDGYDMLKKLGHTIVELRPSLVALNAKKESIQTCKNLQGLSLKNVRIEAIEGKKNIYNDFGEMIFTNFGLSGPIILSASAHFKTLENAKIVIDLKPGLSREKLDLRVQRDFEKNKNKDLKNSLFELLPKKLIPVVIELSGINENKKVNEITKIERKRIVDLLKEFEITIDSFRPIEEAIITKGGVSTKEINPKTMESKIVKNLFLAGEMIDVDAYTGGFNLQIAYSTGYTAGESCCNI